MVSPQDWSEKACRRLMKAAQANDDGEALLKEVARICREAGAGRSDADAGARMACLLLSLTAFAVGQFELAST
jgi:hypothetical protein